jgi:hypothetical protein
MRPIYITKADGDQEPFDPEKLLYSLNKAGATTAMQHKVLERIMQELRPGMTTYDIFHHAFEYLREAESDPVAARYSIKRAVFDLGPSGFPFEQFLAELFRAKGWSVQHSVTLHGKCVSHEVDVRMVKDGMVVGIEAKFHNDPGLKTDVKDALYVKSRYDDLRQTPDPASHVDEGWLVTNTRFTSSAIRYGRCSNLTLLGWDYPNNRGILNLIEETGLHPLTALTKLKTSEKRMFLENNIVLCRSLKDGGALLRSYGIPEARVREILSEVNELCSPVSHKTNHQIDKPVLEHA